MARFWRFFIYACGLIIITIGIVLNTKAGLGVTPINSVPYSISQITGLTLGDVTFLLYIVFIVGQLALKRRNFKLYDILQIPLSVVISRFINLFNNIFTFSPESIVAKILLLLFALVLIGVGVAMTVDMRLVPNAPDGFAHTIANSTGIKFGLCKNLFDLSNVLLTVGICVIFSDHIIGIGIGTLAAVFIVGRVVAVFNSLFEARLERLAGIGRCY